MARQGSPSTRDTEWSSAPVPAEYLAPVIGLLAAAIPQDVRSKCMLGNGKSFPAAGSEQLQQGFLLDFVREKLDRIAQYEYRNWLNGRMPFVSPRQLQLWRLRQFAEFILDWDLPDDEALAVAFNLTNRQAANLVSDFYAKFRKLYVFPRILRRLFALLSGSPAIGKAQSQGVYGRVYRIPSKRYVEEMNVVINELRENRRRDVLASASFFRRNPQLMWVAEHVLEILSERATREALESLYPVGGEVDQ